MFISRIPSTQLIAFDERVGSRPNEGRAGDSSLHPPEDGWLVPRFEKRGLSDLADFFQKIERELSYSGQLLVTWYRLN